MYTLGIPTLLKTHDTFFFLIFLFIHSRSLPLLFRAGFLWTFLFFLATFHLSLPRPTQSHFITNLQEGWKEGTKLTFHSMIDPDIDVVFIIVEGKHERFRRKGMYIYIHNH